MKSDISLNIHAIDSDYTEVNTWNICSLSKIWFISLLEYSTILKSLDISTGYSFEHQIIMYINEFQHIRERIGKIIKGKLDSQDRDVIYTAAFVTRMKCQIRGALSAVTRYDPPPPPTPHTCTQFSVTSKCIELCLKNISITIYSFISAHKFQKYWNLKTKSRWFWPF